jgi:hypothetical protein
MILVLYSGFTLFCRCLSGLWSSIREDQRQYSQSFRMPNTPEYSGEHHARAINATHATQSIVILTVISQLCLSSDFFSKYRRKKHVARNSHGIRIVFDLATVQYGRPCELHRT